MVMIQGVEALWRILSVPMYKLGDSLVSMYPALHDANKRFLKMRATNLKIRQSFMCLSVSLWLLNNTATNNWCTNFLAFA
jgi:hypothetical protein